VRAVRIFQPDNYTPGQTYTLTAEAGQHVGVVLRMQPGDILLLFTGDNREYQAHIIEVHKKKVIIQIDSIHNISRESPRGIHLAQAIAKGDRMEWIVQKAVELGVTSFRPLLTEHCAIKLDKERLLKKCMQWQAIAIAACEQCGRNRIPLILEPLSFDDYVLQSPAELKLILHPEGDKHWRDYPLDSGDIDILIGPEGGFSFEELNRAKQAGFHPLRLGPRIMRTETAGIVALSLLQAVIGDL
jgi:16S rRNA (uracil1498-N3)-methyltransferase